MISAKNYFFLYEWNEKIVYKLDISKIYEESPTIFFHHEGSNREARTLRKSVYNNYLILNKEMAKIIIVDPLGSIDSSLEIDPNLPNKIVSHEGFGFSENQVIILWDNCLLQIFQFDYKEKKSLMAAQFLINAQTEDHSKKQGRSLSVDTESEMILVHLSKEWRGNELLIFSFKRDVLKLEGKLSMIEELEYFSSMVIVGAFEEWLYIGCVTWGSPTYFLVFRFKEGEKSQGGVLEEIKQMRKKFDLDMCYELVFNGREVSGGGANGKYFYCFFD